MFERTPYTVREDLTDGKNLALVICATAEELTQAVTVTISTTNGTAIGEPLGTLCIVAHNYRFHDVHAMHN